ncbi:MAG: hypothetical protein MR593_09425 [Intestinibacter sp.]|uniref:hypothetical protein n=1 Tax=Intestinibacter sp. TaxID=1965304 RepID=UPI0025C6802A|nr:hypothetical protein [Intestinibacter sp.]MCI6738323.1 hypothetical protein [Intestinibacter sp.]
MKLIKKNKPLFLLIITLFLYLLLVVSFINPLIEKNNELEERKSQILILKQEQEYIETFNQQKKSDLKNKKSEDIILSIEKNIGDTVDINSIIKREEQDQSSKNILLELSISSTLENIFKLDTKLKKLKLENSIESIKIENSKNENDKSRKVNCTMLFKVD